VTPLNLVMRLKNSLDLTVNSRQRTVIIIGVAVVLIMGLIPPWLQIFDIGNQYRELSLGYEPIFSPPRPTRLGATLNEVSYVSLDVTRLAVQWITVCLVTIGLSLALREARGGEKKHSDNRTKPAGIRIEKQKQMYVAGIRIDDPADD